MKKFISGAVIALCYFLGLGIFNLAAALDISSQDLSLKYSSELKPISNSFQIAKSTFLLEYGESSFSGYKTLDDDYNFKNCEDYPHSSCPTGARCESCPFNVKKYKVVACTDPYIKSEKTCVCPTATPVIYPNDVCTKYCGSTCIAKTCTPTANKTTCTNDFRNCDNGCGQNTRKCCNPCTHKITSKPENSSYTYCDCTDDDGAKKIQCGCVCNSGYHLKNGTCENGGICEKDCIANNCSGYPLSSCPANANCSKCTITATNCSTDGTKYKIDSCNDGYTLSGNVCRAMTCEEKGQKTCNGSCIATSECCGGCPSGQKCSNGTCVANSFNVDAPILYSDMTVDTKYVPGKTPIGIVFDQTKKRAIALTQFSAIWSSAEFDIPGLSNRSYADTAAFDGKTNTQTISDYCKKNYKDCPIVTEVLEYETAGTSMGDWYVPDTGELQSIFNQRTVINNTLKALRNANIATTELTQRAYWSSSEYDQFSAWGLHFDKGSNYNIGSWTNFNKKTLLNSYNIRPVINYGGTSCTPKANETNCQYGSYSCSDGCGGSRFCCKKCLDCAGYKQAATNACYTIYPQSADNCINTGVYNTYHTCLATGNQSNSMYKIDNCGKTCSGNSYWSGSRCYTLTNSISLQVD